MLVRGSMHGVWVVGGLWTHEGGKAGLGKGRTQRSKKGFLLQSRSPGCHLLSRSSFLDSGTPNVIFGALFGKQEVITGPRESWEQAVDSQEAAGMRGS